MPQPTSYPESRTEKNLTRDERDHPNKEHHRDHHRHNERTYPSRNQDGDSRNHRERDYSKQNRDRDRDRRKERSEERRFHARGGHSNGDHTREDRDRRGREYHKRENQDHHYHRERKHHSHTDENSTRINQQNYRNEKESSLPHNERISYRHKNYAETAPPEYIITEDKRSEMQNMESEDSGGILNCYRCRYLCTNRGIVQMLEAVLNLLVLVCVVASYIILSGYSSNGGLATSFFSINSDHSPLEGEQLKQAQKLDREFILMRAPELYTGIGVTIAIFAITLGIMVKNAQLLHKSSMKWLIFEVIFNVLASLGYAAAVGLYLYFILQVNSTDVCKERELLYARYGLNWMNCDLSGSDAAAACFGILLAISYCGSAILAVQFYRKSQQLNRNN